MPGKDQSPAWKNPRDFMRRHLKRKSSSRRLMLDESRHSLFSEICAESEPAVGLSSGSAPKFLRNPFKRVNAEKGSYRNSTAKDEKTNGFHWDNDENALLEFPESSIRSIKVEKEQDCGICGEKASCYPIDFSDIGECCSSTPKNATVRVSSSGKKMSHLPVDLRLGTKVQVVSHKPFSWMSSGRSTGASYVFIPGIDTDMAVQIMSQGSIDLEKPSTSSDFQTLLSETSELALLQASSMYWQYPSFPWMPMFPRLEDGLHPAVQRETNHFLTNSCLKSVDSQWTDAFEQLYLSWKKGTRRVFYVCCPKFTVVFTKFPNDTNYETTEESLSTSTVWVPGCCVIVAPTNFSLRSVMKDEGIEFQMPLKPSSSRRSSTDSATFYLGEDDSMSVNLTASQPPFIHLHKEQSLNDTSCSPNKKVNFESESPSKLDTSGNEIENAEWLKDIGISPRSTLKLKRHFSIGDEAARFGRQASNHSLINDGLNISDYTRSVVSITNPSSIQALFNLLNSSKICRSLIGPQGGLPPTLIASQPFLHSSLQSLSKSSQIIRKRESIFEYVFEMDGGPIMPHCIRLLSEYLVRSTKLNDEKNSPRVRISNRNCYQGFNEAFSDENFSDFSEFTYSYAERMFHL
ncbi:hypothetical protein AB6A40_004994 [Gnathostoma spinigerum]|uniref:Uncharacterized protein n=1 Tax=Gnathostoma spinigerum TaxID=75299 RepID=A0ABD6EPV1_9BILA